ncbi:MAG: alpha-glucan family phosphorylase [Hydrogenobaculum sp.]
MIAYFVMECGVEPYIPTYSGGLGVLAGDTLQSLADLKVPSVGVTILWRKGYTSQHLTTHGAQTDFPQIWDPSKYLKPLDIKIKIPVNGQDIYVTAWKYDMMGISGHIVPVLFLDTNLKENQPGIRQIFDRLYLAQGKDRMLQEIIFGIGGYELLKALGYKIMVYHINESHSAFLTVGLLKDLQDIEKVRDRVVFVTHTPVAAAFDKFPIDDVKTYLKDYIKDANMEDLFDNDQEFNLSWVSLKAARTVAAVSKKHKYVSEGIFEGYKLEYITNGVHHIRWASPHHKKLYTEFIKGWEEDPSLLRQIVNVPDQIFIQAHQKAKEDLIDLVNSQTDASFSRDWFTIGVARRMTAYKRNQMILKDLDWLIDIANDFNGLQIVFSGKAHPLDGEGKAIIKEIFDARDYVKSKTNKLKIAFIENYDMYKAKIIISGVDIWLNTPQRPLEASGTSGMKAALNGVPNFSVLDGWWIEGCMENINGWSIGKKTSWEDIDVEPEWDKDEIHDLYNKLRYIILPTYYNSFGKYVNVMKMSVATVSTYFNTNRMVMEYITKLYLKNTLAV